MALQHSSDSPDIASRHMAMALSKAFAAASPPGATLTPSGGAMLITGEPHPLGNFAIGLSDAEIPDAAAKLAETGMPACLLFADGVSEGAREVAAKAGFGHQELIPAMAVQIENLPASPVPPDYRLVRLVPGEDGNPWTETLAVGYGLPQRVADAFSPETIGIDGADDAEMQFFAAMRGDQVAAVSMLITGQGVAGIYCVATLPEHRQRGLGAALTAEPLRQAAVHGYRVGVLQASDMGHSVYRRLGFSDTGSVVMLLRMPE